MISLEQLSQFRQLVELADTAPERAMHEMLALLIPVVPPMIANHIHDLLLAVDGQA